MTSISSVSNGLLQAPYQLNIWFGSLILITSNISTIGNLIVFSSRSFRNRACTIYLLSESIVLIFFFDFVLLTRTLQKGFQIPVLAHYDIICRIRYFASQYTNLLALSLFIFASFDRLLSAQRSQTLRQWSNRIDLAFKLVPISALIWFLFSFHRLIFYNAFTGHCIAQPGIYALLDNYFEAVISGLCPPIIIFILSYLLMKTVRGTIQRRIVPVNAEPIAATQNPTFLQKTDKQLPYSLFLQTLVAIPAFLPYAIQLIYSNMTENWNKSAEWIAWENVCVETIHVLSYTFFSTQFYVSFMASSGIRKQILKRFGIKANIAVTTRTMNAATVPGRTQ